jgi:hypothetical protein
MPPNHVLALEAGVIVVSAAVTAAVAIYRSPEVQRHADAVRRRIAEVLHHIGDNINPPQRQAHAHMHQPFFNRPEDAYAYWEARGQPPPDAAGGSAVDADEESRRRQRQEILHWNASRGPQPDVDADDDSRLRQREEIMYWNAIRESQEQAAAAAAAVAATTTAAAAATTAGGPPHGTSFDDFLSHDRSAGERGAYIFNSGSDWAQSHGLVHRRPNAGWAGPVPDVSATMPYPPSAYERTAMPTLRGDDGGHAGAASQQANNDAAATAQIDAQAATTAALATAAAATVMTTAVTSAALLTPDDLAAATAALNPFAEDAAADDEPAPTPTRDVDASSDPFSDVHAWARDSQPHFYSPLPETPLAPASEPSVISGFSSLSDGQVTPTDSVSVIDSDDVAPPPAAAAGQSGDVNVDRPFDVLSESEGVPTPASWSEVGSVVSEDENWRQ